MSEPMQRKVWMSEELAIALGADRVEWGEPDADGFYTPTLYKTHDEGGLDRERLRSAMTEHAADINAEHGYQDHCGEVCLDAIIAEYALASTSTEEETPA